MNIRDSLLMRVFLPAMLLLGMAVSASAQINFRALPVTLGSDVNEEAAEMILRKIEHILTRNSAAAGADAEFGVEASLSINEESRTSGLVRNVTSISGELTLTALSTSDGTRYYSMTVPLKTVLKGKGSDEAALALAKSIKPTDSVYTRFIRIARQKIEAAAAAEEEESTQTPDL